MSRASSPDIAKEGVAVEILYYYSREWRVWVITAQDASGDQIGEAEYAMGHDLKADLKRIAEAHRVTSKPRKTAII